LESRGPAKLLAEMRTPPEELLVGGQDEHASLLLARSPMRPGGPAVPAHPRHRRRVVRYAQSAVLAQALAEAGVPVRLVPIEGADHIINGHHDIDAVVRLSVEYLAERYDPGLDDHWSRNPSGNEDQHRPDISDAVTNGRAAVVRR
jgi:hypothetical protein